MLCNIFSAYTQTASEAKQVIKIRSINNSTPELLTKSCSIIKERLNDFGLQNFQLMVNSGNIEITFGDKVSINEMLPLFTAKGSIAFYETHSRLDVVKLLKKDDTFFSILNASVSDSAINYSTAIMGFCKPENISKVDKYIAKHYVGGPNEAINFLWSKSPNKNGDYYLYLLKHNASLGKQQILDATENEYNDISISFNESGTLIWQSVSRNNLNKPIAIVIDNKVYAAPIVKNEISGGNCIISGDYSLNEVRLLKSLITNDELPLEFDLIK